MIKRMRRLLFVPAIIICALSSCTKQEDLGNGDAGRTGSDNVITEILVSVDGFDGTKTQINSDFTVHWKANDQIGFIPAEPVAYGPNEQAVFYVDQNMSPSSAVVRFKANGWGLLRNKPYYSYYPYSAGATYNCVTVSYDGQTQTANDDLSHLGAYDYLYSYIDSVGPLQQNRILYHHLGVLTRFEITVPETAANVTFKSMTLTASDNIFVHTATFNPSSPNPVMTPVTSAMSNTMTVSFGDGFKCNNENKLIVYAMVAPSSWSGKSINLTLDGGTTTFSSDASFSGKENALSYNYSYASTVHSDQPIDPWVDLSAVETANCYIVSSAGQYKFLPRKGNSNNSVTVTSVGILWSTFNTTTALGDADLISSVTYDSETGYIKFTTISSFTKGNVIIAAYNGTTVQWTWHIWLTDMPADQLYPNSAGYLMDRNLGALSTTGNQSTGFLYQWGRKDPFPGIAVMGNSGAVSDNNKQKVCATAPEKTPPVQQHYDQTNPWPDLQNGLPQSSMSGLIQQPWLFICAPNDWLNSGSKTRWKGSTGAGKTEVDPCPPGYMVPDGSFWTTAFGEQVTAGTTAGVSFNDSQHRVELKLDDNGSVAYLPIAGFIGEHGAMGSDVYYDDSKHAALWNNDGLDNTATLSGLAGHLDINMVSLKLTFNTMSHRASAQSVRCMKIPE